MAARYLVTGAAGFIASRVTSILHDAGNSIVGIDNLNAAYDPRLKRWRLAQLKKLPRFEFHQQDITDAAALKRIFDAAKQQPFDAVFNLAARAGVQPSVEDPHAYLRTNAEGTLNLLELCREHGVKKFVLASTS